MIPRSLSVLVASLAVVLVAACSGAATAAPATPGVPTPAAPQPTPVPTPVAVPTPTPSLNAGDVETGGGPELSVEFPRKETLQVTLQDRAAKAWRLIVAGTGAQAQDRLEIVVETGDVGPAITVTEVQQGEPVSEMDLSGYLDGTAAAGGCHATLPVCIDSSGFRMPADGDGVLSIRLRITDPAARLVLTGGTATWPGEPFILGPWTDTEPFPWGQG